MTSKPSTLIGIATHQVAKGKMTEHHHAFLNLDTGLGDYRGRKNPLTAVTILSLKSWNLACQDAGTALDWTNRRAQLLINNIDFSEESIGKRLKIGQAILKITTETDPCRLMDKLHPGLKTALTPDWRGGARCEVIQAGEIKIGDEVTWLTESSADKNLCETHVHVIKIENT